MACAIQLFCTHSAYEHIETTGLTDLNGTRLCGAARATPRESACKFTYPTPPITLYVSDTCASTRKWLYPAKKGDFGPITFLRTSRKHASLRGFFVFFFLHAFTFQLLDNPWSQVSSLLPPDSCLQFLSRIGFSNPTARRFFIECC